MGARYAGRAARRRGGCDSREDGVGKTYAGDACAIHEHFYDKRSAMSIGNSHFDLLGRTWRIQAELLRQAPKVRKTTDGGKRSAAPGHLTVEIKPRRGGRPSRFLCRPFRAWIHFHPMRELHPRLGSFAPSGLCCHPLSPQRTSPLLPQIPPFQNENCWMSIPAARNAIKAKTLGNQIVSKGLKMVALPGFEPRQTDPESVVLPLHHKAAVLFRRLVGARGVEPRTH